MGQGPGATGWVREGKRLAALLRSEALARGPVTPDPLYNTPTLRTRKSTLSLIHFHNVSCASGGAPWR